MAQIAAVTAAPTRPNDQSSSSMTRAPVTWEGEGDADATGTPTCQSGVSDSGVREEGGVAADRNVGTTVTNSLS